MTGWKTFASPVYSVLLTNVSAGVLQTIWSWRRKTNGSFATDCIEMGQSCMMGRGSAFYNRKIVRVSSGKSLILVINFYFYKLWGCKSLFTNTGIIQYMYAWSYILIQKNVRKQNKNEIPWIYMYKNFGRSKVQVTSHRSSQYRSLLHWLILPLKPHRFPLIYSTTAFC